VVAIDIFLGLLDGLQRMLRRTGAALWMYSTGEARTVHAVGKLLANGDRVKLTGNTSRQATPSGFLARVQRKLAGRSK